MNGLGVLGLIIGALIGVGALVTAIRSVRDGVRELWRFGGRAVHAVQIITDMPERLTVVEDLTRGLVQITTDHLAVADGKTQLLDQIATDLGVLVPVVRDVHHEVKHNGGSSMKDALARLETGVKGLYQPAAATGPVVIIPTAPAAPRTRKRATQEAS